MFRMRGAHNSFRVSIENGKRREQGIILIMVLWLLTFLMVVAGEFSDAVRIETKITRNFKDSSQAYYIALAGANQAVYELVRDFLKPRPSLLASRYKDLAEDENIRTIIRTNVENPYMPFNGGKYKVWVGNTRGKININLADRPLLEFMLNCFQLDKDQISIIIDSILDWRDTDSLTRLAGAEDSYYQALPVPYACKNGPFETQEEIMRVRGVTKTLYYSGLQYMITVYPFKKDSAGIGTGKKNKVTQEIDYNRINLNAMSKEMLLCMPQMTHQLADNVMAYRQQKIFDRRSELREILGFEVYRTFGRYLTDDDFVYTPYFHIKSIGTVNDKDKYGIELWVKLDLTFDKNYQILFRKDILTESF